MRVLRSKKAGAALGVAAALVEVRGDWQFFKECFAFPGWKELAGCCWRCRCTPSQIRDVGLDAPWRKPEQRMSHWDLMRHIQENGRTPSPIFSAPWVRSSIFKIDWLHAVDHGVAQVFLGNLIDTFVQRFPGANKKERYRALWQHMRAWYEANNVEDRIDHLVPNLVRQNNKAPLLRASAAKVRALVPYGVELTSAMGDNDSPQDVAAKSAAFHLNQCYKALSEDHGDLLGALPEHSRKFAWQLVALERSTSDRLRWQVKPKLHLFLELCLEGGRPSLCWTYRDEDFGGSCARMSRRRGGLLSPTATSECLLQRFAIKEPIVRI